MKFFSSTKWYSNLQRMCTYIRIRF